METTIMNLITAFSFRDTFYMIRMDLPTFHLIHAHLFRDMLYMYNVETLNSWCFKHANRDRLSIYTV